MAPEDERVWVEDPLISTVEPVDVPVSVMVPALNKLPLILIRELFALLDSV